MSDRLGELTARIETLELELGRLKVGAMPQSAPADAAARLPANGDAGTEPSASRRDLLRYGAAALGAAAAAGMAASTVEAADGGAVLISVSNSGTGDTYLTTTSATFGLYVTANASSYGLLGVSSSGIGTYGFSSSPSASNAGVQGVSASASGQAPGVSGTAVSSNAPAVYGRHANGGNAIRAEVPATATANAIALYALNYSSYTGGGAGTGGFAIYGLSAKGHGLLGATAAAGAAAVVGATNGVAGAYAAAFYGPVIVGGDFTVVGGAKSAAVPHPDGSHRRLYCMESPESWFEDFGRGTLVCGEAVVPLDRDFAAVVDATDYLVFITGNDGRSDLSVCDRTSEGFRVKAIAGDVAGTFSWRVVARRKDIAGVRFEPVEIPKAPTLPDVPASAYEPTPPSPDMARMGTPPRRPNPKP